MSHTIIKQLRDVSEKYSFLDFTTVWNHHSITSWGALIKNKRSNLFEMLNDFTSNDKKSGITIVMGAAGRSQHSASEVVVFKHDQSEKLGGVYYSRDELTNLGVC